MNPADYIRAMSRPRRKAFVLALSRHPLLRHATQTSINSTLSMVIYGKIRKVGLASVVAWEDVTQGSVTWQDWIAFTYPEYSKNKSMREYYLSRIHEGGAHA